MRLTELEKHLRAHGCRQERERGNHTIWKNPAKSKSSSVPRHREINEITAKQICKQLEIPQP